MTRSIVVGALCVCSVAKTRCPVSAAVSAVEIVSRSRISPTRITSGSWRSAARRPSANVVASWPISRWLTMHVPWWCRNSIGSSIVRMCSCRVLVDVVEQRRERRRLAGAGRPGDEHEAARLVGELVEPRREAELLERLDLVRDEPERGADGRALEVGVDAEAREAGNRVREVDLPARLEDLLLLGREDPVHERPDLLRRQLSRGPAGARGGR